MDADGKNPQRPDDREGRLRPQPRLDAGRQLPDRAQGGRQARRHPARGALDVPPGRRRRRHQADRVRRPQQRRRRRGVEATAGRSTSRPRRRKFNYTPELSDGLWQIWRYDRDLAETFPVAGGFGGAARPALSPDGKTLTFVSPARRRHLPRRPRPRRREASAILARGVTRDEMEGFAQMDLWPGYAFTPDGKSLVFSNHGKLARLEVATGALGEIPFTAEVEQFAAPRVAWQEKMDMGPVKAKILRWPSQSPDGRWIAFEAFGRVWLQEVVRRKGGRRAAPPDARRRVPAEARVRAGLLARRHAGSRTSPGATPRAGTSGRRRPRRAPQPVADHEVSPATTPIRRGRPRATGSRSCAGSGPRVPRPTAGGRRVLRDRPPRSRRAASSRPVTTVKLAQALEVPPQVFWSADGTRLYFREPRRAEEAHRRPQERSRLGASRRHGRAAHCCAFRRSPTSFPPPTGPGSPSRRATTST